MPFEGMDVDAIRRLGNELGAQSRALGTVASTVTRLVAQAQSQWRGPDASRFAQSWTQEFKPRVVAAVQEIEGLSRSALNNAAEQDQTSGASDGDLMSTIAASGRAMGTEAARYLASPQFQRDLDTLAGRGTEWMETHILNPVGAYAALSTVKNEPWLKFLEGDAGDLGRYIDSNKAFGALGDVLNGLHTMKDGVDALHYFQSGDVENGVYSSADAAAGILKESHVPVGYLGGVVVAEWTDVARLASQTDWSTPLPPLNADTLTSIYLPSIAEAVPKAFDIFIGNL